MVKDVVGKKLIQWRLATVLPHVKGRLLDIGCGTNDLVRAYSGEGIGVDVHPWEGVDQIVEDTAELPFPDGSFDTVAIIAALNHIPNRSQVLKEAHRVLRPGGAIVTTMIPPRISQVWHFLRRPWDLDQGERGMKEGEVWGLTRAGVRQLLTEASFEVEHEERFMLWVNQFTLARRPAEAPGA